MVVQPARFVSDLVGNFEYRLSRDAAEMTQDRAGEGVTIGIFSVCIWGNSSSGHPQHLKLSYIAETHRVHGSILLFQKGKYAKTSFDEISWKILNESKIFSAYNHFFV